MISSIHVFFVEPANQPPPAVMASFSRRAFAKIGEPRGRKDDHVGIRELVIEYGTGRFAVGGNDKSIPGIEVLAQPQLTRNVTKHFAQREIDRVGVGLRRSEAEDCSFASLRQPAAGAQRSVLGGNIADTRRPGPPPVGGGTRQWYSCYDIFRREGHNR